MQFAPKFIDLVRNYTSTSGTNDFVLGPAVNGFSGFADALQPGDSFYYSAAGVDYPGETEVGRGTLLNGGIISRDPLNGVKTDFSSGTKSIALVAASEWFTNLEIQRSSPINVKTFGAKGDANEDASTGTDDTTAIQAALDHIGAKGGGTLFFPEGIYKVSSYLTVPANAILRGTGRKASKIIGTHAGGGGATAAENARNGSILYSAFPINTSSRADLTIEHLWIHGVNPANEGAGFYQQSGVFVSVRNCEFSGNIKWGIILDQSEIAVVEMCELGSAIAGGAGLWIVNGPDLDPAASSGFTNVVAVRDCSLNVAASSYGAVDDGGYEHLYIGCTFTGGINGLHACGVDGLHVQSCYAEAQTQSIIALTNNAVGGGARGSSIAIIEGGQFSPAAGKPVIEGEGGPGTLTVIGGSYGGSGPCIANTALFWSVTVINPGLAGYPDVYPFCDGSAGGHHFESSRIRANADGRVGIPNIAGTTGGITLTPGASGGFVETFNSAGARQGYGFLLSGGALQFAAEGAATSFQFLDPVSSTGSITSTGGGIGYAAGAGGTVNQATSKSTGVTLNKLSGQISLAATALAGSTTASFKLTNSKIAAGDLLILNHVSGGTLGAYALNAHGSAAGSVNVDVTNVTANSLSEAIVIGFAVIKAVTA